MKKSRRYLLRTALASYAFIFFSIGFARSIHDADAEFTLHRPSATELAELQNFDSIEIVGNFNLTILQGDNFAVNYSPLVSQRGQFTVEVKDQTLIISGHRNMADPERGELSLTMPTLNKLDARHVETLTIGGFDQELLSLLTYDVPRIEIKATTLTELRLDSQLLSELRLVGSLVASKDFSIASLRSPGFKFTEEP